MKMTWEQIKNNIIGRIEKIGKHDKLFLDECLREFRSFVIFAVIGGFLAYFTSDFLIQKYLTGFENRPELMGIVQPNKILVSVFIGIIIASFYLPFYIFISNKEAFSYFFRLRGDNINYSFRKVILTHYGQNITSQLKSLVALTKTGEIKADYSTQYLFARIFCETATEYFWATSFDKPSEFPIRNISYLQKFDGMKLTGFTSTSIPKKARIFITTYKDLVRDIAENKDYLLQLMKMHLHYHNSQVICSVRFFLCKDEVYQEVVDILKQCKVSNFEDFIYDYFIIDDSLIYGRKNKKLINSNDEIFISFIVGGKNISNEAESEVDKYKDIYSKLWGGAFDIKSLTDLLSQKPSTIKLAINNFASAQLISEEKIVDYINRFSADANAYYESIENTVSTDNRYGPDFSDSKVGKDFFEKWIDLIKKSKGFAWAVDSSERKEGDEFYRIWDSNRGEDLEYRQFFDASMDCAKNKKCDFKRIFIIKSKIPEIDNAIFNRFLVKAVEENNMKVGVIISDESNLSEQEQLNQSDFLIIDVKQDANNKYSFENARGFTLRNEQFKIDRLKYSENLILVKDFPEYQNIFEKLWNNPNTVHFETQQHITDTSRINLLIKRI